MGDRTGIQWTDSTWNPITGCVEVSHGCNLCYAKTFAERWRGTPGHYFENGFDVQLRPDKLMLPTRWKRPRKIFVNSMSDLFHEAIPDHYIAEVFAVMATTPRHTYQVLTKRHGRMRSLLNDAGFWPAVRNAILRGWSVEAAQQVQSRGWPLSNIWLGVSTEDQRWADIRIPALAATPAAIRFVSAEPLLGPIDLFGDLETPGPGIVRTAAHWFSPDYGDQHDWDDQVGVDWVITGGESGRGARPMQLDWVRSLRDQCQQAGIPFHFKQLGSVLARELGVGGKGGDPDDWPELFPREYPA